VFQIEIARERLVDLDAKALAAEGPTPAKLAKVLEKLGSARVLYLADQTLAADGIPASGPQIARDTPYVTGREKSAEGEITKSVDHKKLGAKFDVSASCTEDADWQTFQVRLGIEFGLQTDSRVQTGEQTNAPIFWNFRQHYGGATELGQPVVLISADGTPPLEGDRALALITLVEFSAAGK
jgi:hypothetical protein